MSKTYHCLILSLEREDVIVEVLPRDAEGRMNVIDDDAWDLYYLSHFE